MNRKQYDCSYSKYDQIFSFHFEQLLYFNKVYQFTLNIWIPYLFTIHNLNK